MKTDLTDKKIFFIAGNGNLPITLYNSLQESKNKIFVFSMYHEKKMFESCQNYKKINFSKMGYLLSQFKKHKPTHFTMAGGVKFNGISEIIRGLIFHPIWLFKILRLIKTVKIKGDNGYLELLHYFLEKQFNTKILSTTDIDKKLTNFDNINSVFFKGYENDAKLAFELINTISAFDVGQAVVIQEQRFIAIEAQEGTQNMIKRCAELKLESNFKPILVKKTKLNQDKNIDLPTIGIETVKDCYHLDFAGIVIEKNNTIVLDKNEIIAFLEKKSFFVVAL
jgi:DUF1009 family protein